MVTQSWAAKRPEMSHTPTTEGEFEMVVYDEAKVLVLYSGGTIGMLATDKGYVPEKGYLTVSQISPVPASRREADCSPSAR